jgi:uncharacterized SAM-binding protein YcdF (DUF218 family)
LFFGLLYVSDSEPPPADLIASFQGRDGRTRKAYELAERGYAPALVISPATESQLRRQDRIFGFENPVRRIIEPQARTTFENALYTAQIMQRHDLNSVILVTSWDHMPRSYLLLRIMRLGSDTRIQPYTVATGRLNRHNWHSHLVGWKMVYNEMVQCWGSLMELAQYKISGRVSSTAPGKTGMLTGLKKRLRFEINPDSLNTD